MTRRVPIDSRDIILFDGVCVMCSRLADFVIERDPTHQFAFASLQSEAGRSLTRQHRLTEGELGTMVLIEKGIAHVKSDAALRVARRLRSPWSGCWVLVIVPRRLRNAVYDWVGRNRYRWFGQAQMCRVPTPEDAARFIE